MASTARQSRKAGRRPSGANRPAGEVSHGSARAWRLRSARIAAQRRMSPDAGVNICRLAAAGTYVAAVPRRRKPRMAAQTTAHGRTPPSAPQAPSAAGREAHVQRLFWRAGLRRHAARGAPLGAPRQGAHDPLGAERRPLPRAAHEAAARGRARARPRERVGPRRALVARPDGPLAAPAPGEAHALLARPLRHRGSGHAADAGPEPARCAATRWAASPRCCAR